MMPIARPLLTEKTLLLASRGWYTFGVDVKSSKRQIAQVVGSLYKVKVVDVRTSIRLGKEHKTGRKQIVTRRPDVKRALVRLAKGQTIPAFEITPETEKK